MSFRKWLMTQKNRQDRVGDLARDVARDVEAPENYRALRRHIMCLEHCDGALEAIDEAYSTFKNRNK